MFDKILYFFVNLLPPKLRALFDKFEELIVYVYYGLLTTILNLIVQTAMQFGVMALVNWDVKIETTISTVTAWLVAVIFAFYVNKKYVFKSDAMERNKLAYEFFTFTGARVLSLFMEWAIMMIGTFFYHDKATDTDIFWLYMLFKFTAQVVVTLANYFFSKLIVFRKKKESEEPAEDA